MIRNFLFVFLALTLFGCSQHRADSIAHVAKDAQGRFEIRLDAKEWSMGGPCNIAFPHPVAESHWIYTKTLDGEVMAKDLVLTYQRGKTEYPWPQESAQGSIRFSNSHAIVALQRPVFKDGVHIDHYEPYPLNGDYSVDFK